jgi:hypothetical protein
MLASEPVVFPIGKAYTQKFFWAEITDNAANKTTSSLGSYRTQDTTPPIVTSSLAAGTPAVSAINLTYTVSDNSDQLSELWVRAGTAAPANAQAVRDSGVSKTAAVITNATHTFSSLTFNTLYYVTVLAVDAAGNATMETKTLATANDTTTPTLTSYLLRAPVGAEGSVETDVVIVLVVADVVG